MSVRKLLLGRGTAGAGGVVTIPGSGWVVDFTMPVNGTGVHRLAVDNSGNSYGIRCGLSGTDTAIVFKLDATGAVVWQKEITGFTNGNLYGVAVDGSGNFYLCGGTSDSGDALLVKLSSAGAVIWKKTLGAFGPYEKFVSVAVDSSGNPHVIGRCGSGGTDMLIAQYDTLGNLIWQRSLGSTSTDYGGGIAIDSSGNIYILGITTSPTTGNPDHVFAKYNSAGALLWQRSIGTTGGGMDTQYEYELGICVSGSNVYLASVMGAIHPWLAKYDAAGALVWQREITTSAVGQSYTCVTTDSDGYVYVGGSMDSPDTAGPDPFFAKYSSAGVLQWLRRLRPAPPTYQGAGVQALVVVGGSLFVSGPFNNGAVTHTYVAQLPKDGSLLGTYGIWQYAVPTLSEGAGSRITAASALTGATSTLPVSTTAVTLSNSTLTVTQTSIP